MRYDPYMGSLGVKRFLLNYAMFIGFLPYKFVRPIECLMIAYRSIKPKHAAHFRTTEVTRLKSVVVDNYILHVSLCAC